MASLPSTSLEAEEGNRTTHAGESSSHEAPPDALERKPLDELPAPLEAHVEPGTETEPHAAPQAEPESEVETQPHEPEGEVQPHEPEAEAKPHEPEAEAKPHEPEAVPAESPVPSNGPEAH